MTTESLHNRIVAVLVLGLAVACEAGSARAAAEAAPPADAGRQASDTLQEVVVTAQFRQQNLQETPIAITAINSNMLEQRSQTSIADVANQAPNVTLKPAGPSLGPSLIGFIRGVGQTDFNYALEPGVGMYVDDVYYSTLTGSLLDLLDLDRVEVLRGPQGTLAGKNSIGGAIKLFSKKPAGSGTGYLAATFGGLNRADARGSADFTVLADRLFVRIAGATRHHDGYVTRLDYACTHPGSGLPTFATNPDCRLGEEGGQSYGAVRVSLRWLASDAFEVNLSADRTKDDSPAPPNVLLYANNPALTLRGVPYDCRFVATGSHACDPVFRNGFINYETFLDARSPTPLDPYTPKSVPAVNTLNSWGVQGTLDWEITHGLSLKSITAQRYYDSDFGDDASGAPITNQLLLQHLQHRQWSQELRLNGDLFSDAVDYTLGGFYFDQRGAESALVDIPYALLDFLHGPDNTVAHTKAGFLHASWHTTKRLTVSAGVRYSKEDKTYTYHRHNADGTLPQPCTAGPPGTPGNPPNCALFGFDGLSDTFAGSRWDSRFAADYQWTQQFMTYAQYSTGYKGGGINPRPFFAFNTILPVRNGQIDPVNGVPTDVNQIKPFGPETLKAYEIGFKSSLFERRMRLNVAAFYNQYNDIQLSLTACPIAPCILPSNAGDAHVKGLELETEMHAAGGLEFDGSASYLDFKYVRLNPATNIAPSMVTPYTPKWKWSAGIQYEIPLGTLGSLTPRIDASYQSTVFTAALNAPANQIDGYTLANARLVWNSSHDDWQAAFEVTNFTDKYYFLTKFDLSTVGAGFTSGQPGMPREWAVTIKRSFH